MLEDLQDKQIELSSEITMWKNLTEEYKKNI
jgi:hypothetical protein